MWIITVWFGSIFLPPSFYIHTKNTYFTYEKPTNSNDEKNDKNSPWFIDVVCPPMLDGRLIFDAKHSHLIHKQAI